MSEYLPILYSALKTEHGLVLSSPTPVKLLFALYAAKKLDAELAVLTIRRSTENPTEILILKDSNGRQET